MIVGGGGLCPTASLMLRADTVRHLPEFHMFTSAGDVVLQSLSAYEGQSFFLDETMGIFRRRVPGSWTHGSAGDLKRVFAQGKGTFQYYQALDKAWDGKHRLLLRLALLRNFMYRGYGLGRLSAGTGEILKHADRESWPLIYWVPLIGGLLLGRLAKLVSK